MLKKTIRKICILLTSIVLLPQLCSCARTKGNVYPLDRAYLRPTQLNTELHRLAKEHPGLVKLHLLGLSTVEELPVHALEIGTKKAVKDVLIIGQHHGDEVLGIEVAMAFAKELVNTSDKKIQKILEQYRFWVIPTMNPEGFRIVSSGEYALKRKNNRDSNQNGVFELRIDGVDLNRNYPVFWENDNVVQPEHAYFKGPSPASESEVQAVIELAQRVRFSIAMFYHSSATGAYSEKIYLPWHDPTDPDMKQRYDEVKELAEFYALLVPMDYAKGTYEVHQGYNSKLGNARNYFFHSWDTNAFLIEIGGIDPSGVSIIHPDAKMLKINIDKHIKALKTFFYDRLE